jgi:hypothetical protein
VKAPFSGLFKTAALVLPLLSMSACTSLERYPLLTTAPIETPTSSPGITSSFFPVEQSPTQVPTQGLSGIYSALSITPTPTSPTLPATFTPQPSPTSTPAPTLRKISEDGCCTQPFWSPDGREVLFFDKPSPEAPAGLWGIEVETGTRRLITERAGIYSPDLTLAAFLVNGQTVIERLDDGVRFPILNGGRRVVFSPSGDRVAWVAGSTGPPIDLAWREIWVSSVEGDQPTMVFGAYRGVLAGWSRSGGLLVSGRLNLNDEHQTIWAVDPDGSHSLELGRGFILRGGLPSPRGDWLAYQALFSEDSGQNGLWISNVKSGENYRLELFGSYRWRDNQHLLVFSPNVETFEHELWQIEAGSGLSTRVGALEGTGHKVAGGDWQVSPSGDRLVFVSSLDYSLWLIEIE